MHFFTRDRTFYREYFYLLFFIALQNMITFGVNLADNIMLGVYSESALSGVALANQIQFFLQMLVGGISEGIVVLSAQYWGRRETKPIKQIIAIGLRVALVGGVLFLLIAALFPRPCLALFCKEAPIISAGEEYLRIICYSYVFFCLTGVLVSAMRSVENVRIGMVTSLTALACNVLLNYVLIFGHWGFPRLGVRGAAIATLISRLLEFSIVLVYVCFVEKRLRIRPRDLYKPSRVLWKDYARVGSPVVLSNVVWAMAMAVQTAVLGHLGGASVAANSVATSLFQIVTVVVYGGSSAASVVTGKLIGSGNLSKLRPYVHTMQALFLFIGAFTGLTLYASKDWILSIYQLSANTAALAEQFMQILSITVVGTAYQVSCLTGIVRGGGNTRFVLYNDLIFQWLIVLPASVLSAFVWHLPPVIVFACLKSDQILKCFVAVVTVNRYHWVRLLTRADATV